MNPGLAGLGAAFSWGVADFMSRFNSRAIGSDRTVLVVLGLSCLMMAPVVWGLEWRALANVETLLILGFAAIMTVGVLWLLYETLSRGPLSIVVPILACYPAPLVLWAAAFDGLVISLPLAGAMGLTLLGVWIVARAGHRTQHKESHALGRLKITLIMAFATLAMFDIYVLVMDQAVAEVGHLNAVWLTRFGGLIIMALLALARRRGVKLPFKIWAFLGAQSAVDALGFIMLFSAQGEGGTALATVTSSAYGIVTVLLARVVLKEVISPQGWAGIAMAFTGVVTLSWLSAA